MTTWARRWAALLIAGFGCAMATAAQGTEVPVAAAAPAKPLRHHAQRPARVGNGLEERVRLLAAELKLDEQQQAEVRRVLTEQRQQTLRVWSDDSVPAPVRVKATQDVAERTAARIRALLRDDQRRHYLQQMPDDPALRGNSADLANWMDKMQGRDPDARPR